MSFLQREGSAQARAVFAMRAEEREAVQHLLLEVFQVQIDHRRDVQRDELARRSVRRR